MAAQAISNANLLNHNNVLPAGFTPNVSYSVSGSTVTVTDACTIPAGDVLKAVHLRLCDKFGGEVRNSIVRGGSGYTDSTTVSFSGGGGSGATATATIVNGKIASVAVTAGGTGYNTAPTVSFSIGSGATATATISGGVVTAVTVTPTTATLSTTTLNTSKGLDLVATVVTNNMIAADGSAQNIGSSGSLASWDIQQNA